MTQPGWDELERNGTVDCDVLTHCDKIAILLPDAWHHVSQGAMLRSWLDFCYSAR